MAAMVAMVKPEFAFPYLLALVAHHPDLSERAEDLALCARYLDAYVEAVAEPASLDYLYHVATVGKAHEDAHDAARTKVRLS